MLRSFTDIQKLTFSILFVGNLVGNCNTLGVKLSLKLIFRSVSGSPGLKSFREKSFTYFGLAYRDSIVWF